MVLKFFQHRFYELHNMFLYLSNILQRVMYSESVRSENWKLNLLINFKFSEVIGREGKMRFSEV